MADVTEPPENDQRRMRRWLTLGLAIIVALVVYGFGFETTDVDLGQVRNEDRREQLYRILRALARPDLTTYDFDEVTVMVPISVPCGTDPATPEPEGNTYLVVTPSCAAPGDTVTIEGFGFEPNASAGLDFIPNSEFAISLPLARFETDAEGHFTTTAEIPDRESDEPQAIQAVTKVRVGTWTDRVDVWNDTNNNGVEDLGVVPESGMLQVEVRQGRVGSPGLVALIDGGGDLQQLLSLGSELVPGSGPAKGSLSFDIGTSPTQQFTEDATGDGADIFISSFDLVEEPWTITVAAPAGSELADWEVAVYDDTENTRFTATTMGDLFAPSPRLSENALETWDKIVETVFLALLATTAGTILAVPLSFLAARNLMRDISTTVTNLSLVLVAIPAGAGLGAWIAIRARDLGELADRNAWLGLLFLIVLPAATLWLTRRAVEKPERGEASTTDMLKRYGYLLLAVVGGFGSLVFLSRITQIFGGWLEDRLGAFAFMGRFSASVGEIIDIGMVVIGALVGAGIFANLANKIGYGLRNRIPMGTIRILRIALLTIAGAVWGYLIGQLVNWFYQFETVRSAVTIPVVAGALIGLYIGVRAYRKDSIGIGLVIYYIARTTFNGLRSIEPLVMGIVFVVWVGFGPFAGSLALALHTTAALAKLYSEQVESIDAGPLEAVRATGATRLQTVVYAVVPQIVPPYISFTMYRWDINVRMSTIIGFVGGGGIGFLLQQNINLLNYRKAAAQMLAIAIVVASMDYISARLRERLV